MAKIDSSMSRLQKHDSSKTNPNNKLTKRQSDTRSKVSPPKLPPPPEKLPEEN
jgi:hypothetical protein